MNSNYCIAITFSFFLLSCSPSTPEYFSEDTHNAPSHQTWDTLLSLYVDSLGNVDYQSFKNNSTSLDTYLELLKLHPPTPSWTSDQQKAYWINAYNAHTISLIVKNYPVKSITDLHPAAYIPFINTVWHIKNVQIGKELTSLDRIEHAILRKQFDDPRIHFAINCASKSCPTLKNSSYKAANLSQQLDSAAALFINDTTKNIITNQSLELSSIFNWFESDFTKKGSLIDFISQYSKAKINKGASINYLDYNWFLNESISSDH